MSLSHETSWTDVDTKTLISVWGDVKMQQNLDGSKKKKAIYENIAKLMTEKGYNGDGEQCKIKLLKI